MKTVKLILFSGAFLLANSANADLYKCMKGGRPVYQGSPCEVNTDKGKLDIKEETPQQKALALEKLKEIRTEYDGIREGKQKSAQSAADAAMRQNVVTQYEQSVPEQAEDEE